MAKCPAMSINVWTQGLRNFYSNSMDILLKIQIVIALLKEKI